MVFLNTHVELLFSFNMAAHTRMHKKRCSTNNINKKESLNPANKPTLIMLDVEVNKNIVLIAKHVPQ